MAEESKDFFLSHAQRRNYESQIRAKQAAERLADLRPRWLKVPHQNGQIQFLQSRHKIRIAIPGNGWGKTTTMAMAADMMLQKDDPFNPDMVPKWSTIGIWVCQKYQQMDILRQQLEEEVWTRPWEWNQSRHFYGWPNGSKLYIISADSAWEHVMGIPVDFVCFDEHPEKKLWTELQFRRRGKRKTRYMVAATMVLGMTWFVKEIIRPWESFHKDLGLTGDQARTQQKHPDTWVWDKGGIRDNPALDVEDIAHYESIGSASSKELSVRLKGGYADFTGDSVFDHKALDSQLENLDVGTNGSIHKIPAIEAVLIIPDKYKGLDLRDILRRRISNSQKNEYVEWVPDGIVEGGRITVWAPPELHHTYVMGADFAAGLVGRDYDALVVMKKNEDGHCEQVAEARGWWGDAAFAEIIFLMGCWYFNAFLVGERQFGLATLRRLYDEWHYPYIYRGRNEVSRSRRPSDLLGHHRSSGDTIIPNLRGAINKRDMILRSEDLMQEMRQYQFRPKNSSVDPDEARSDQLITSAPQGLNDDLVMALAYAWHAAREVGRFQMPTACYEVGTFGHIFKNASVLKGKPVKKHKLWI